VNPKRKDCLELFDLERELGETVDLSGKLRSKTAELHNLLNKFLIDD